MQIKCPNCGAECEAECKLTVGQHVMCPFCHEKFVYASIAQGIAPLLVKAKKGAITAKYKMLTAWKSGKDGRRAFFAKVKMAANVVWNKTVSLWKSGWNGKVILCAAALLALWFVWPSGKGDAETKREAEMTVEEVRHKIVDTFNEQLSSSTCPVRKRIEDAHGTVTVSHAYVLKCDVTTTDGSDKAKNISLVTVTIRFNWDGILHKGGTTDLEVDLTAEGKCTRSRIVRTDAMVNMEDEDFWYDVGQGIGAALLAL